jgi:hypothetical protein
MGNSLHTIVETDTGTLYRDADDNTYKWKKHNGMISNVRIESIDTTIDALSNDILMNNKKIFQTNNTHPFTITKTQHSFPVLKSGKHTFYQHRIQKWTVYVLDKPFSIYACPNKSPNYMDVTFATVRFSELPKIVSSHYVFLIQSCICIILPKQFDQTLPRLCIMPN